MDKDELNDSLAKRLKTLGQELKEARKVLRRDWETLSPKDRSAASREVKRMEAEERALLDEIEMNRTE
jgi:hypothetical protein